MKTQCLVTRPQWLQYAPSWVGDAYANGLRYLAPVIVQLEHGSAYYGAEWSHAFTPGNEECSYTVAQPDIFDILKWAVNESGQQARCASLPPPPEEAFEEVFAKVCWTCDVVDTFLGAQWWLGPVAALAATLVLLLWPQWASARISGMFKERRSGAAACLVYTTIAYGLSGSVAWSAIYAAVALLFVACVRFAVWALSLARWCAGAIRMSWHRRRLAALKAFERAAASEYAQPHLGGRLGDDQLASFSEEAPPPGAVTLWYEHGGGWEHFATGLVVGGWLLTNRHVVLGAGGPGYGLAQLVASGVNVLVAPVKDNEHVRKGARPRGAYPVSEATVAALRTEEQLDRVLRLGVTSKPISDYAVVYMGPDTGSHFGSKAAFKVVQHMSAARMLVCVDDGDVLTFRVSRGLAHSAGRVRGKAGGVFNHTCATHKRCSGGPVWAPGGGLVGINIGREVGSDGVGVGVAYAHVVRALCRGGDYRVVTARGVFTRPSIVEHASGGDVAAHFGYQSESEASDAGSDDIAERPDVRAVMRAVRYNEPPVRGARWADQSDDDSDQHEVVNATITDAYGEQHEVRVAVDQVDPREGEVLPGRRARRHRNHAGGTAGPSPLMVPAPFSHGLIAKARELEKHVGEIIAVPGRHVHVHHGDNEISPVPPGLEEVVPTIAGMLETPASNCKFCGRDREPSGVCPLCEIILKECDWRRHDEAERPDEYDFIEPPLAFGGGPNGPWGLLGANFHQGAFRPLDREGEAVRSDDGTAVLFPIANCKYVAPGLSRPGRSCDALGRTAEEHGISTTDWHSPDRSTKGILDSLTANAEAYISERAGLDVEALRGLCDSVRESDLTAQVDPPDLTTVYGVIVAVNRAVDALNPDRSAGWTGVLLGRAGMSKGEALELARPYIVQLAVSRILRYLEFTPQDLSHLSAWDLIRLGLRDPVCPSVKDEAHPTKKAKRGAKPPRWRSILVQSMVDEVVGRVAFEPTNAPYVTCWQEGVPGRHGGSAAGLGLHDAGVDRLRAQIKASAESIKLAWGSVKGVSSDVKGFDWSMSFEAYIVDLLKRRAVAYHVYGDWWRAEASVTLAMRVGVARARSCYAVGDVLLGSLMAGTNQTGVESTTYFNSGYRAYLAFARYGRGRVVPIANGDDCVELVPEDAAADSRGLGHVFTDETEFSVDDGVVDFCSHHISMAGGPPRWHTWKRSIARLVYRGKLVASDQVRGLLYGLRGDLDAQRRVRGFLLALEEQGLASEGTCAVAEEMAFEDAWLLDGRDGETIDAGPN